MSLSKYFCSISRVGSGSFHPLKAPLYDDVVDKTDFRPDAETVRGASISKLPAMQGVYDYEDGEVTDDKRPSDIVMALREGLLDKADLPAIESQLRKEVENENEAIAKKLKQSQLEAVNEARQKYLDSLSGFDKNSVPNEQGENTK